jgi:hypothetical protein
VERWNGVDIGRSWGGEYVCGMRGLRHGEMVKGQFRSDREVYEIVDGSSMRLKNLVIGASRIFTQLLTYLGFAHKFSVDQVLFMLGGLLSEQNSRLNCSLARPQRPMDNGGIYSIRRVSDV